MLSADKIKMNILFLIGCRSELSCSNIDQISVFLLYLCVLTLMVKFRVLISVPVVGTLSRYSTVCRTRLH